MPRRPLLVAGCALAAALVVPLAAARAQSLTPTRPWLRWETIETEHFAFHFPREMREWTVTVAERVEAQREAVAAIVGYAPRERVHVLVEDPYNVPNGAAFPLLGGPAIMLWPVPPEPTSQVGDNRSWGEVLAVHEFAHIAHLARPSRNPRRRLLSRVAPVRLGPIAAAGRRWLWEGYATYVEGRLTGTGRPHGVWRAALLRQWALEGKLPTYAELDATSGYKRGSYAYLVGSAYLEWLVERKGDSSLVHLWRRMTARTPRSFDAAFRGVYGASPADLYGRFTAEMTARALRAEEQLTAAGLAPGTLVQKLDWYVGDPAVSPDGKLLALQLRSPTAPSRVVVWTADSAPVSERERRARARQLERDPEDVPAVRPYPRHRRTVATLQSSTGVAFESPRFFADGERLLVSRADPMGDGTRRSDLYVWNRTTRRLRRVTHGAAVRHADPSPDGREAVGVRCLRGACDLVRVELANGHVSVVAAGAPARNYYRPRFAPDGRAIAYTVQDSTGVWRVGVMDASGGGARLVGPPDGANRYGASFTRDGRALVLVSELGGVPNLERLELATGATRPLTRVLAAAYPPATGPASDDVYYLSEHAKGLDLYRVHLDSARADSVVTLASALAPVARIPTVERDTFAASSPPAPHPYGVGPRRQRLLPAGGIAAEGRYTGITLVSADPAGRLGWNLAGAIGDRGTWRGGALQAEWRGLRPTIRGDLFYAEQKPSRQRAGTFAPRALDGEYAGAALGATLYRDFGLRQERYRAGLSAGTLRLDTLDAAPRQFAFVEVGRTAGVVRGRVVASLGVAANGAVGRTAGDDWRRATAVATASVGTASTALRGTVAYGATSRGAPEFERFVAGGVRSPLVDPSLLAQRVPLPAAPVGVRAGRELYSYRVSLGGTAQLTPYFAGVSSRGGFSDAFRVVGAESSLDLGNAPIIAVPAIRALVGVGYTLDEPFRKKPRAYLTVEYKP